MGIHNYLIEGVSGSGKTTVCDALLARGEGAVHGDRVLAYQGDPLTGAPLPGFAHGHHIWDVARVRALAADRSDVRLFFCGGSRNHAAFLDLIDGIFILRVDAGTLQRRLMGRGADEFGSTPEERAFVARLHETGEDLPSGGTVIDATRTVDAIVDDILRGCG